MKPLNYAVLKYFQNHKEGDATQVMDALQEDYSTYRSFKKKSVIESLMTAHENGLLDETHFELDQQGDLRVYYAANDYGLEMIEKYIK